MTEFLNGNHCGDYGLVSINSGPREVYRHECSHTGVLGDDIGYIRVIDYMGSDAAIVESARMSTQKGFLGWGTDEKPGDEKLLKYLYENKHSTPFEFCELVIEVKAPIFVFREWHRHRTQSYNEMSARYIPLPDENYIPTLDRVMINYNSANKQSGTAKDANFLNAFQAQLYIEELKRTYEETETRYQNALKRGVPKELARLHIPVGRYSIMRAKANLRNWLAFLTLRMDKNAQWEIRQYANSVSSFIELIFPRTFDLFIKHVDTGA